MKFVSIASATLIGNRGAESMLTSTIGKIREKRSDVIFNVFSYYPQYDKLLCHDTLIKIYSSTPIYLVLVLCPLGIIYFFLVRMLRLKFLKLLMPKPIIALAGSDILIDLAGVSFIDGREKFLLYNTFSLLPAMLLGVPVVKYSQAMGPFHNPINRFLAKIFLGNCQMVFARGEKTFKHLDNLGIDKQKFQLSPDVAFLHRQAHSLTQENTQYFQKMLVEIRHRKKKKLVGICPSAVIYEREKNKYLDTLIKTINYLLHGDFAVLVFPNASLPSSQLFNNDLIVIEELKKYCNRKDTYFVDHCINTSQITELIKHCTFTVVSRLHATVASLKLGIPVIVVGWGHKYDETMQDFSLQEYVCDYTQFNERKIKEMIQKLLRSQGKLRIRISSKLKEIKRVAEKQIDYVVNEISSD